MNTENLKKWGSLVLFLILAGISCWATEHSFHLLIKFMPEVFVWGLTVAFFIVASYGTKLMVDALNRDVWVEHRRRDFWIGTVLVLVFWLLMSMPTNTHTFFYNFKIGPVAQEDIAATDGYLSQIRDRVVVDSAYYAVHDEVNGQFNALTDEFNGIGQSGKKGGGEFVRQLLRGINETLERELPGSSIKFDDAAWNKFDPKILSRYEDEMNMALEQIKNQNYRVAVAEAEAAGEAMERLEALGDSIKAMVEAGEISEEVVTRTEGVLLTGYTTVKNNARWVVFDTDADRQHYTQENLETRTKRMLSVIDVWIDFCAGRYPLSFLFYILLSVLVDVAAFMFFDFAFKKQE